MIIGETLFVWIFSRIADDLYTDIAKKGKFHSKLRNCAKDWTSQLPRGYEATAEAIFAMDLDVSNPAEFPKLGSLKEKISLYMAPTRSEWLDAFMEIWEYRKQMAPSIEVLTGFFHLDRREAIGYLSKLSDQIHNLYLQNPEFFRPSTFNMLEEILDLVKDTNPSGATHLNNLAKKIKGKINSCSYVGESIIEDMMREMKRISKVLDLDYWMVYCNNIDNNIRLYNQIPKTHGKVKEHRDFIKKSHLFADLETILAIAEELSNA